MASQPRLSHYKAEHHGGIDDQTAVVCMCNGSTDTAHAARRGGAILGAEALNSYPPSKFSLEFVDYPFTKIGPGGKYTSAEEFLPVYIDILDDIRPQIAVAPDVDTDTELSRVVEWADTMQEYCETVVIPTKSVHPSQIPSTFRVGYPTQDKFGGCRWRPRDFADCAEVHLLGGSPHDHFKRIVDDELPIASVDTSVPIESARFGDSWGLNDLERPQWNDGRGGMYGAIEQSFNTMCRLFNPTSEKQFRDRTIERPDWEKHRVCGYPPEDLLGPQDEMPFPGREYHFDAVPNDDEWTGTGSTDTGRSKRQNHTLNMDKFKQ